MGIVSLLLLLSVVAVVPAIAVVPSTDRLELIRVANSHSDVICRTANAPFDVESSEAGLEVVPGPSGPTAMTKKCSTTNLNVQLVQIGWVVSSWLGAKGTLAQDHMAVRSSGSFNAGIAIVFGAIFENRIRRHVDGVVVFADKRGRCILIVVIGGHVPKTLALP